MKTILILLTLIAMAVPAFAGKQKFWVSPTSDFTITSDKNGVSVEAYSGAKGKVVYKARLKEAGDGIYKSEDGVTFTIEELKESKTIDQGPKYSFTTNRQLTITGSGNAYKKLAETFLGLEPKDKAPKEMVFYHDSVEMTSQENR